MRALEILRGTRNALDMYRGTYRNGSLTMNYTKVYGVGGGHRSTVPQPSVSSPPAPPTPELETGGPPKGTARLVGEEGVVGPAVDGTHTHSPMDAA